MDIKHFLQKNRNTIILGNGESPQPIADRMKKGNLLLNEEDGFYMKVNCEIMQEAGITGGDTIFVNKMLAPLNGNVVVAIISADVVIRFYQKIQSKIFLSGDIGKVAPIQIDMGCEEFQILGVVTYVVKKL